MCGIFATTRADLWEDRMEGVLAALRHRGPDASGTWRAPGAPVLLGHTRLSIIGLSPDAAQPLCSPGGDMAVTYNGEIYNYRQVARDVGIGAPTSDTQVLAEVLRREGVGGLGRFRGMYAFAAWDSERARLVAARDRFGIKPLYVLEHPTGGVTVASTIPVLLLRPEARDLDPTGVAHYLAFGHTGPTLTLYRSIRKVAPGTGWSWPAGPGAGPGQARPVPAFPEDGEPDLGTAVESSVEAHLVADVEVGVFLSSGTDSSLLAAVAAGMVPALRTFTLSFPEFPQIDEGPAAEANARLLGTRHTTVRVTVPEMRAAARDLVAAQGEPLGDDAALPLAVLSRTVSRDLKVVLAGEGSDELFGGYRRYGVSRWLESPVVRGAGRLGRPLARRLSLRRGDGPRARALEAVLWGGGLRAHAALLSTDLTPLSLADGPAEEAARLAQRDWDAASAGDGQRATARAFDLARWLPDMYLEKTDRATMLSGLEARVPYLDPVVAGAARRSVARRFGKEALREELLRRVPGLRLPGRKKGLTVDLRSLLAGELSEAARFELESRDGTLHRVLGAEAASVLRTRCARSRASSFRVAMLGLWDEAFSGATTP